jgi:type III secretion protein Q
MTANAPAPPVWSGLPALSGADAAMRQALAPIQRACEEGEWYRLGELEFALSIEEPLAMYAVRLDFDSGFGRLIVHAECAALLPEYSADTLQALRDGGSDVRALLDWAVSPWIEPLERALGCAFRLDAFAIAVAPPSGGVACAIRTPEGRVAHVALSGPVLAVLGKRLSGHGRRRVQPWMRIPLARVLRLKAVSRAELRRLAPGAAIDLRDGEPVCVAGDGNQRKEWMVRELDDDNVEILGEAERPGAAHGAAGHHLWSTEELTLDVDVVLSREALNVEEASALCVGSVLRLKAAGPGEQVSLYCQGLPIAKGRLVRVDDGLAVLVTHCRNAGP